MGLFKKIGKSLKSATKVISIKNAVGIATGTKNPLSIALEAGKRVADDLTKKTVQVQSGNVTATMTPANAQVFTDKQTAQGKTVTISDPTTGESLAKAVPADPSTGKPATTEIIKDAGKVGLSAIFTWAGAKFGGTKTGSEAGADFIDGTLKAWFKRWWWVLLAIPVVVYGVKKLLSNQKGGKRGF